MIIVTSDRNRLLTLLFAGFSLVLLQFFMIREITSMLKGTELVIVMVTVAYFTGYSVGYGLADKFTEKLIVIAAIATWALHLTMPFSLRWAGGVVSNIGFGLTFLLLLFVAAFLLSSFYSLLLPRYIDALATEKENSSNSLAKLYGAELIGAVIGGATIFFVAPLGSFAITFLYQVSMAITILFVVNKKAMSVAALTGLIAYATFFTPLWDKSLEYYYHSVHDLDNPRAVYSAYTPYQKVDLLEASNGRRYLYLDGLQNYGDVDLSVFNSFLTGVPIQIKPNADLLIVGSGSMESVARATKVVKEVTTVEIDPGVIKGSREHLANVNRLDEAKNWTLVIDDAKHFMGSGDKKYDVIILDIPAPLTIQVGLLYSVDFFELIKKRLKPGGIVSVTLAGNFQPWQGTPRTIAAAMAKVFDQLVTYTPQIAHRSFAIAGAYDAFTIEDVKKATKTISDGDIDFFDTEESIKIINDKKPMTVSDMSYPVKRSLRRVKMRLKKGLK